MEKKALGRGLGALIPEVDKSIPLSSINKVMEEGITALPVEKIRPNPYQPREDFKVEEMQDLVNSIQEKGVIQPILVRRKGDAFELIAGERRLRAAKEIGLKNIPVVIKDVDDKDSLELALIENIQRQQLNTIEEARAYQYLINKFQMTQEKISQVLGKSRVAVTNILRILKLPLEIQDELKNDRITYGHARALLEVEDINNQRRLVQQVISKSLSVRELENLIKNLRPVSNKSMGKNISKDAKLTFWEEELQQVFGTKVKILKKKKRGHITIEFYSEEEMERVIKKMKGENI